MKRRMFDHLYAETSVAIGTLVPRYALWMELHDGGRDPDTLTRAEALEFVDRDLRRFLESRGLWVSERAHHLLRRHVRRFSPDQPTPYERFESWGSRA